MHYFIHQKWKTNKRKTPTSNNLRFLESSYLQALENDQSKWRLWGPPLKEGASFESPNVWYPSSLFLALELEAPLAASPIDVWHTLEAVIQKSAGQSFIWVLRSCGLLHTSMVDSVWPNLIHSPEEKETVRAGILSSIILLCPTGTGPEKSIW